MPDLPDWYQGFQLVGSDITINVNIEASDVTLPISIDAVTADLDVTIIASDVSLDIIFTDQSVAVWGAAAWFSRQGEQVFVNGVVNVGNSEEADAATRTVPANKVFYIVGIALTQRSAGTTVSVRLALQVEGSNVILIGGQKGDSISLDTPIRATAGEVVVAEVAQYGYAGDVALHASFWGWDEDA